MNDRYRPRLQGMQFINPNKKTYKYQYFVPKWTTSTECWDIFAAMLCRFETRFFCAAENNIGDERGSFGSGRKRYDPRLRQCCQH